VDESAQCVTIRTVAVTNTAIGQKPNLKPLNYWRVTMKNVATLAILLGLASNLAIAESAVSEAPLTLAMNNNNAVVWAERTTAIDSEALGKALELTASKTMERISLALEKQLEDKITQELEYVMD
jgi:hypothetical protein